MGLKGIKQSKVRNEPEDVLFKSLSPYAPCFPGPWLISHGIFCKKKIVKSHSSVSHATARFGSAVGVRASKAPREGVRKAGLRLIQLGPPSPRTGERCVSVE